MIQAHERVAATARVARTGRIAKGEIGGKVFDVVDPLCQYKCQLHCEK
jgi:hypothetical protein